MRNTLTAIILVRKGVVSCTQLRVSLYALVWSKKSWTEVEDIVENLDFNNWSVVGSWQLVVRM